MKFFHILPLIFAAISAVTLSGPQLANGEIEGRITHAQLAHEGQFPYQVAISSAKTNRTIGCGGALIDSEWVLTAGHCLFGSLSVNVSLGSARYFGSTIISAEYYFAHENFTMPYTENDLGLIKIPKVALNSTINVIKLPSPLNNQKPNYYNSYAVLAGWGATSDKYPYINNDLHWAVFEIVPDERCSESKFFHNESLCLGTPGGMSPCFGDSGSPLVSKDDNTLIGVTSAAKGDTCETDSQPSCVRVADYLDWIYSKTGISY